MTLLVLHFWDDFSRLKHVPIVLWIMFDVEDYVITLRWLAIFLMFSTYSSRGTWGPSPEGWGWTESLPPKYTITNDGCTGASYVQENNKGSLRIAKIELTTHDLNLIEPKIQRNISYFSYMNNLCGCVWRE